MIGMLIFNQLLIMLSIASAFAMLFVFEPYINSITKYLDWKPFNCCLCTAFWGSLVLYGLAFNLNILLAFPTAVMAEMIYRRLV